MKTRILVDFQICISVPLIPAHFFISFFVLNSNPIVDIMVDHLYVLLLHSHKINANIMIKKKKTNVIFDVASNICS